MVDVKPPSSGANVPNSGAIAHLLSVLARLRERASHQSVSLGQSGSEAPIQANSAETTLGAQDIQDDDAVAPPRATLGAVMSELDERAYGFLLLLLALPCCLPFVYILPQIVALPMLALAGQMAMGRPSPWLPKKLESREFVIAEFEGVLNRAAKYIGWFERFAHHRFSFVTSKTGTRLVGAILLIPCASILVPLPTTNTLPGIGVTIASVGLIERDGILVFLGILVGLLWVIILLFLGFEAASIIKSWALGE